MTTISHIMQPFVVTHWLLRRYTFLKHSTVLWISSGVGLLGGLPDIVPIVETSKGNYNGLYVIWHDFSWMSFLPPIGFHQLNDWLTHNHVTGEWFWWVYLVEVLGAAVIIGYAWYAEGKLAAWIVSSLFAAIWIVGILARLL
jgi:hypothetical protein